MRIGKPIIGYLAICCFATLVYAQPATRPATQPGVGRFPNVEVNIAAREIRIAAESLRPKMPLEFFCVTAGGSEHEAAFRTKAKPSHIHAALLMLGLTPGEGIKYSEATKKWLPPHGPPLAISLEYTKDGVMTRVPAGKFIREVRTQKPAPAFTWVFTGSRVMEDGVYAADVTGYVVTMVNFELSLIDVPKIAGEVQETLEWEVDPVSVPAVGTPMTLIIQPVDGPVPAAGPTTEPSAHLSNISTDQAMLQSLRQRWNQQVRPHAQALEQAAQAQYEVLASLRKEQQRLVDEADRIQRMVDQLEREWQEMTTPRPEAAAP